jgi:chromosome partitioning protein
MDLSVDRVSGRLSNGCMSQEKNTTSFTVKKVLSIFGAEIGRSALLKAESSGAIPEPGRQETGAVRRRSWSIDDLPAIGERYGFLKKPASPVVLTTFTTKGGVLKTTLALNIARMAALHNIRTCVVGLDLQGDISASLGLNVDIEESESMSDAIEKISSPRGLFDFMEGEVELEALIMDTDIPTLKFIPETPELVQLEQAITLRDRREYWLKEKVVSALTKNFDLVIIDCSPNWNRLVTNALVASDLLVSPLECKINNFRNFSVFRQFLTKFRDEMRLKFTTVFVPTRFSANRKLSTEIRNWYLTNAEGCIHDAIRESTGGEEATAMRLSLPEYAPTTLQADEVRNVLSQVWNRVLDVAKSRDVQASVASGRSYSQANTTEART